VEVWQIFNLQWLRLGEEKRRNKKEERKKKKSQGKNIMACPITQGGHKKYCHGNIYV